MKPQTYLQSPRQLPNLTSFLIEPSRIGPKVIRLFFELLPGLENVVPLRLLRMCTADHFEDHSQRYRMLDEHVVLGYLFLGWLVKEGSKQWFVP